MFGWGGAISGFVPLLSDGTGDFEPFLSVKGDLDGSSFSLRFWAPTNPVKSSWSTTDDTTCGVELTN